MTDLCNQCGNEYKRIATHWSGPKSCNHPSLSQEQLEIITGLLMGDGWVETRKNRNPVLKSEMISKKYLQYVDRKLGVFGNGVKLDRTAEESARDCRNRNFSPGAKKENYSDIYFWSSMNHPELQDFADWYSTGEKVWPEDIELTQTTLKHWYCGDGCWNNGSESNSITISMSNEADNIEKVNKIFEESNLSPPSNYNIHTLKDGSVKCAAQFTRSQSEKLWEYMGEPLPDFEYKWPEKYHANIRGE